MYSLLTLEGSERPIRAEKQRQNDGDSGCSSRVWFNVCYLRSLNSEVALLGRNRRLRSLSVVAAYIAVFTKTTAVTSHYILLYYNCSIYSSFHIFL